MVDNSKAQRIFFLILFGIWPAYLLYIAAQIEYFDNEFTFLIVSIIGIIVFVYSILKDRSDYQTNSKLVSFIPTYLGILFILLNTFLFYFQASRTKSQPLIYANYDGGYNGYSLNFRQRGHYIMTNFNGLWRDIIIGKYTIKDSIITLDKSNIGEIIKTNKLKISSDIYFKPIDSISKIRHSNFLTEIDSEGKELSEDFRMKVTIDNRNLFQKQTDRQY